MEIEKSPDGLPADPRQRRDFLKMATAAGVTLALPSWVLASDELPLTPRQTAGPFYPVPQISKQPFHDTDLTKKLGDDETAKGQLIKVVGVIKDQAGRPLKGSVVEIWQACSSGRYNHSEDDNPAELDDDFQFWGRAITGEDGSYEFKTIKPGEYPGRTPHIHYRIESSGHRELVTQMYFADEGRANMRDGIYRSLDRTERNSVTAEFDKPGGQQPWQGKFDIVLAKR